MIIMHHTHYKYWIGILASIFLGMTFVVAGSGKLFVSVVDFELIIPLAFLSFYPPELIYTWLMIVELVVGLVLVAGVLVKPLASYSLILVACFITNNILLINAGLGGEPCGCFGMGDRLSVASSLYLDGVMVALVITVLVYYPSRFFSVRPWYWGKSIERR